MIRTFRKKQKKTMLHALASVPFAPVGIVVSQDHQVKSILASGITGIPKSSTLHPTVTPSPPGVKNKILQALPTSTQKPWLNIFTQNVAPPTLSVTFPPPGVRFENIAQLAYCGDLLRKSLSLSSVASSTPSEPLSLTQQALIEPYAQNEDEGSRIRSLIQRVVEEFVADKLKTTAILSEVLLLAPSLDREHYRKLLDCVIAEFETARLLDITMLQGLVQLVESASSDYLEPDDLVRILVAFRTCLQDTHQHSTEHPYYLTWALSRLLDVMVEGKAKDLSRVVDQEPLSALFNQLKDSNDPFLKHQVTYAFQGLLHVPNDETRRQYLLRYAGNITMGLLGVASVCNLDMGQLKEGMDHLYEEAGVAHEVGTKFADEAQSLFESGQGTWTSVKGGVFFGGRQLWYTSLREAQQYIRNGRLHHFNNLVFEAPCRDHIDFQWGICRLLGGMAIDPLWETKTRQQAVDFLAALYKNDSIWTSSESIYRWILVILRTILASEVCAISGHALLVLQGLENAGDEAKQDLYRDTLSSSICSYPIKIHLPIPASSTLMSRVLAIPAIEYSLLRLKDRRLNKQENALYIQPQAKPSLQSSGDTLFPLMEKALDFLAGPGLVFLLLGDSGGGKSTFNLQLESTLWESYKNDHPIPLHINLPSIDNPQQDMIHKQLLRLDFTETQILELKQSRRFIVICDGYDESQLTSNLYTSNHFNQPGQWKVKMIVTCRTQYLGANYRNRFVPGGSSAYDRPTPNLFQEAVIAPFTLEQIERYVNIYVPLKPRTWGTKDYMDRLIAIPNLMDLVKNPFLLSLALEALPGVSNGNQDLMKIKITRVQLYDIFVQHWFEVNQRRLQKTNDALSSEDRDMLVELVEAGFVSLGIGYSTKLAQAIFDKNDGNPVVRYVHFHDKYKWKAEFFGSDAEVRLLRDSSPLTRAGDLYRFVHRTMLEYFFSLTIYNPARSDEEFDSQVEAMPSVSRLIDADSPLFQRVLLQEPSILNFLCDRVKLDPGFKHQLRAIIDRSKIDAGAAIAATNAITILVRAGVNFNGADLRDIKVPGADLSNGQFDSAQFRGADLTGVNLSKSWLRQADMSDTYMKDVRFGELPYLEVDERVYSCAYSPNGEILGTGLNSGVIYIYDTSTWTRTHRLKGHSDTVGSIVFSPDSQRLVSGSDDKTVRLWDATSGEELLVMEGHSDWVFTVTISPCGNRIASASKDKTVRLWDTHTGETLYELEGHKSEVASVKYSPDRRQLASCSSDGTVRFWDARTGEPGNVLDLSSGVVTGVAYSPDGRWISVSHEEGHEKGRLQLWDAVSLDPGPVLRGHINSITGIVFSPDGRWIASSSFDETVILWDASTSTLVTVLTGHNSNVSCVAFSPDGRQIASGGCDRNVRLWEVGSSWSHLDLRDGGHLEELAYTRDGRSILSYDQGGLYRQWDAATGTSATIPFEMPELTEVACRAFALDGTQLAFGYKDGSIRLWDCQTGTAGPVLKGDSEQIRTLVYSPCCRWIISIDTNSTVRLWDLHDVKLQSILVGGDESWDGDVRNVAFSSTGGQFAIGVNNGAIWVFDTLSRECLSRITLEEKFSTLVYSTNDQQIAIGAQGRIYLWDLQSNEPGTTLDGLEGWVLHISYSSCGQWIASAGTGVKAVGIWRRQLSGEAENWSRAHTVCGFFGWVDHLAWNPLIPVELFTGCIGGSIQKWRVSIDESGNVVLDMVWGANLGALCTQGATFTNVVGLSPIYQKLLVQRGAICSSRRADGEPE